MKKIITRFCMLLLLTGTFSPMAEAITLSSAPADSASASAAANAGVPDKERINDALKEYRSLSKHDRKERLQEAKKTWKQYKADKRAGNEASNDTVLLAILAILLPPLAVYLKEGEINTRFWISVILTLLFWIPGVIYALIIVLS